MSEESIQCLGERLAQRLSADALTIEEVQKLFQHRGYVTHLLRMYQDADPVIVINGRNGVQTFYVPGPEDTFIKTSENIDKFLAAGQHHMECKYCKHILLRSCITSYMYRDATRGPLSHLLVKCPGCGITLFDGNVQEIIDEL